MDLNSGSPRVISAPTDIKTMVTDGDLLYLGTSNGKMVSVPIETLKTSQQRFVLSQSVEEDTRSPPPGGQRGEKERGERREKERGERREKGDDRYTKRDKKGRENTKPATKTSSSSSSPSYRDDDEFVVIASDGDTRSLCLPVSAVAVHAHLDERVKDLLYLKLPEMSLSNLKQAAEMVHYHSLPNLASPYGGRIPVTPPVLSFRSLVISVGKGHAEYVHRDDEEKGEESVATASTSEESGGGSLGVHRERHEAFQLLVWGHKNMCF